MRMMIYFEEVNYFPSLNQKVNFDQFCENFAWFAECSMSQAIKFSFWIFDQGSDQIICEHDIFSLVDILKEDSPVEDLVDIIKHGNEDEIIVNDRKDQLFLNAFLTDIIKVQKCF